MKNLKLITAITIALVVSITAHGYVIMKMWEWFIIDIHSNYTLNLTNAIGIVLIIQFIRAKYDKDTTIDNVWNELKDKFVFVMVSCGFTLFTGWLVTLFM